MTPPDPETPSRDAPAPVTTRDFLAVSIAAFQVLWKPILLMLSGFVLSYVLGWLWFGGGLAALWTFLTGGGA